MFLATGIGELRVRGEVWESGNGNRMFRELGAGKGLWKVGDGNIKGGDVAGLWW